MVDFLFSRIFAPIFIGFISLFGTIAIVGGVMMFIAAPLYLAAETGSPWFLLLYLGAYALSEAEWRKP